jgi:hypothetical protein
MRYLQTRCSPTDLDVPVVDPIPTHLLANIPNHDTGLQLERPVSRTDISISVNSPRHIVHDMTCNASDNAESTGDSLGIPQLHYKRLDPMFLALDDELSEDRAVRRGRCGACTRKKDTVSALSNRASFTSERGHDFKQVCKQANQKTAQDYKQNLRLTSDPPLGSPQMRRMNDKLVRPFVERGGRLQSSDVGSVCQFY